MKILTINNVKKLLKPGETYRLAYNDFNEGEFLYRHKKTVIGDSSVSWHKGEVLCFGDFKYDRHLEDWQDIGDKPTDYLMYQCGGYLCRGSGAERVYLCEDGEDLKTLMEDDFEYFDGWRNSMPHSKKETTQILKDGEECNPGLYLP